VLQVKHEANVWERLYNSYIYTLRLPLPFFFLMMFSTPLLVSFVFTGFYLLDVDGLAIPQDKRWRTIAWVVGVAGETEFKVFVFSLSLCTTFGGTGVEARSTYNLLLANLNTLTAQLIFVFLSGAGNVLMTRMEPEVVRNVVSVCGRPLEYTLLVCEHEEKKDVRFLQNFAKKIVGWLIGGLCTFVYMLMNGHFQ